MRKKWIAIGLAISSFLITTSPYLSISADPLSDLQAQKNASNQKISELEEKREEMVSDFTAYDRKMLREFENNHRLIASKQEELEQREATLSEQEQLFAQKQTELLTVLRNNKSSSRIQTLRSRFKRSVPKRYNNSSMRCLLTSRFIITSTIPIAITIMLLMPY